MKNNMKLTQSKLKQIIEEELQSVLKEETIKNKFNKWRQGRKLKKQSQELERYNNILENEPGLIERIKEFQKLSLELKELEKEHAAMPEGPDKRNFGKEKLGATARKFNTVSDEMTRILKKVRSEHPDLARFLRQVGTKKDEKNPEGRTHPEHPPRAHRLRYAWEPRNWDQSRIDNWQKRRSDIDAIKPGSGLDWVRSLDESKLKQIVQEELQNTLKEMPNYHVRPTMGEFTLWAPPDGRYRATKLYSEPFANIDDAKDHALAQGYIQQYGPVEIQNVRGEVVSTWDTHYRLWNDALSESGR
mgnify:CR=1 FL=1|tara:strand:- start:5163 stop:6068 length:906 start_codon:yes stop_codon:yes gene_type:complete